MNHKLNTALLYLVLTVISVLCIIPILVVVSASFSTENALVNNGYSLWPREFSFAAYQYVFNNPQQIISSYTVTIFVTLFGTIASLLVISLLAFPLSRRDFSFRKQISFYVFFTMLFNGGLVPWYMVITQVFHLKDTIWVLILPHLVTPWFVLLMRTFFAAIPEELIESSKIDGVGEYRLFFQIIIPLSTPVIATVALFNALMYWNDWFLGLLFIENRDLIPLQYLLYSIMKNIEVLNASPLASTAAVPADTARMATAVLAIGPICLVYLFFQKYFVRGLTVGAIKG